LKITGSEEEVHMNWFDPDDDVIITPDAERNRFWKRKFGDPDLEVSRQALFVNNGHGGLFDLVCQELDQIAEVLSDHRENGYCLYLKPSSKKLTVYRAPEPAPYAAADLEVLISAGARQIVLVNGSGSLRPEVGVGSLVLPKNLIREEGTSFHYVQPVVKLSTNDMLNKRIKEAAVNCSFELVHGDHWTTDAILRETFHKVDRLRDQGVVSVDMELSALAGVAHYRNCELSALLVVTDVLERDHTWGRMSSSEFLDGARRAAKLAASIFP
jgi:uridine phosphorylase